MALTMNSQNWNSSFNLWWPGYIYSGVTVNDGIAYFCGANAEVQKVTFTYNDDGSATWVSNSLKANFPYNITAEFYGIDFINISNGWVVGQRNYIFHTVNSGVNWTRYNITPAVPNRNYNVVYINLVADSAREVWVAGENGAILKAPSDVQVGTPWTTLKSGTTASLNAICFTLDSTAYFAGTGGVILKTSDNGNTFKQLTTGTSKTLNSISFMDENYGFAVGDSGTFLKTINAGETWIPIPNDRTKNLYCVRFLKRYSYR